MKRTIVPKGSKIDLEETFFNVQSASESNRKDLMNIIFDTFGTVVSGSEDTSLEIIRIDDNTIEISPGYGLTVDGKIIAVKSTDPAVDKRLDVTGYTGPVYVENLEPTNTSTQILDGFAWLPSGEQHRDTNQYDYYQLTITDPGDSGIYLAALDGGGASITDVRGDNRLRVKDEITHAQNTDHGTSSETFRVGIGSLGTAGAGLQVILEEDTPPDVLNLRVTDVSSVNVYETAAGADLLITRGASERVSTELDVTLEWGYNNVTGKGTLFTISAINEWYIDVGVGSFAENILTGSYLYLPSTGDNLIITGNDVTDTWATQIYVTELNGTDWDGTAVTKVFDDTD